MLFVFVCSLFLAMTFRSLHTETENEGLIGYTEVRYWDAAQTYNGYTLFGARETSYLIDMQGRVVNTWPIGLNPRLLAYNGNLLDAFKTGSGGTIAFRELDWQGNIVWEYYEPRKDYVPHHDMVRIFNPKLREYTTLYIANKSLSHEEAIAAGCDPAGGPYGGSKIDAIVEIDMDGTLLWEWWFFDHVVQDFDSTKANYVGEGKTIADYPGKLNLNLPGKPVKKDWLHCNSLDYNEELDQIVINSVHGEFCVIDHGKTFIPGDPDSSIALAASDVGDFLYRFGDPARYEQGDPPSILEDWTKSTTGHKQIGGSHDIQWIDPGLPGEGNFLVFNNGQYLFERTPQSYVFEINPYLDAHGNNTGNYVNPPDAGYYTWVMGEPKDTHKLPKQMSNQIVWIYYSKSNQGFFSHIGSGAQRLPNGNTLICAMTEGHIFEVTNGDSANGPELLWEYLSPVTKDGILEVITDHYPTYNPVFRAYRYGPDHPALAGRDLTPQATITGRPPEYLTPSDLETKGDVNCDGQITPGDAHCAFDRSISGTFREECLCQRSEEEADINCDGSITPGDALCIFWRSVLGIWPDQCQCPTVKVAVPSPMVDRIIVDSIKGVPGESVRVPIVVENPQGLDAFAMKVAYPSNLLKFKSVSATVVTAEWTALEGAVSTSGVVTIGGFHTEDLTLKGPISIAEAVFTVREGVSGRGEWNVTDLADDLAGVQVKKGSILVSSPASNYILFQNYPNPFNPETEITFNLPENGSVTLTIHNILGQVLETLVNAELDAGHYTVGWNGKTLSSGVYFYRIVANDFMATKRMVLMK